MPLDPFVPFVGVAMTGADAGTLSTLGMKSRAIRHANTVITIFGFTSEMSSGSA